LPTETLNELNKIQAFTQQPTPSSMTAALNAAGYLVTEEGHLKARVSLNGSQVRGWLLGPQAGFTRPPTGLAKNDNSRHDKTDKTGKTGGNILENFLENSQKNHDRSIDKNAAHNSSGLSGLSGLVDKRDKEIDIDFDSTKDKTGDKTGADGSGLSSARGVTQPGDSSEAPEAVTIRFKSDYKTDLPGRPYELVKEGTIAEVSPKRAEHYISKGVAEAVSA
jgi:hypothetical protein